MERCIGQCLASPVRPLGPSCFSRLSNRPPAPKKVRRRRIFWRHVAPEGDPFGCWNLSNIRSGVPSISVTMGSHLCHAGGSAHAGKDAMTGGSERQPIAGIKWDGFPCGSELSIVACARACLSSRGILPVRFSVSPIVVPGDPCFRPCGFCDANANDGIGRWPMDQFRAARAQAGPMVRKRCGRRRFFVRRNNRTAGCPRDYCPALA